MLDHAGWSADELMPTFICSSLGRLTLALRIVLEEMLPDDKCDDNLEGVFAADICVRCSLGKSHCIVTEARSRPMDAKSMAAAETWASVS